ncbi:MAG TPA: hypothetical protein VLG28_09020 [Acidimicrobiia bacterium]|jgi:hypothetical protein|nr:hypothetical protein [Acidimicrobiia bacterium]
MTNHEQDIHSMDDQQLLAVLGQVLDAADPVPAAVTEFAKAGFGWRNLENELAELVFDSATEELVGVRSEGDTRQVTFRAPGVEIEVAVVAEGARRIVGQLVPPQAATIELRHGAERQTTRSDTLGRFTFHDVPAGPVSLRCDLGGDHSVQTDWLIV